METFLTIANSFYPLVIVPKLSILVVCQGTDQVSVKKDIKKALKNTRKRCEVCPKLTIKTLELHLSDVFIVDYEHVSHLFLVFLLLTLNK